MSDDEECPRCKGTRSVPDDEVLRDGLDTLVEMPCPDCRPVIGTVPLPGSSKAIHVREGETCTLHELEGRELVDALLAGMCKPEGVDVCAGCVSRCREFLKGRRCRSE